MTKVRVVGTSGAETAGYVPVADGLGGFAWQAAPGAGSVTKAAVIATGLAAADIGALASPLPSSVVKGAATSTFAFAPSSDVIGIKFSPVAAGTSDSVQFADASATVRAGFKSDGTFYSKTGSWFGNNASAASTMYAGAGSPPSDFAAITLNHNFGQGGPVTGTTLGIFAQAKYYNAAVDDSAEGSCFQVLLVNSGTPFIQTLPVTGLEGDAVIQGANTVSNMVIGVTGWVEVQNTAIVTSVAAFNASAGVVAAGAAVTNYYGYYDHGMAGGSVATNTWSFYGPNTIQTVGNLVVGVSGVSATSAMAIIVGNSTLTSGTLVVQPGTGQSSAAIQVRSSGAAAITGQWFGANGNLYVGAGATGGSGNGEIVVVTSFAPTGTPVANGCFFYVDPADGQAKIKNNAARVVTLDTPLTETLFSGLGFLSWAFDWGMTSGGTQPTAGTVYARALPLRAGQVIGHVDWLLSTAAVGTAPTGVFVGIANSAGTMLAQSANLNASAIWLTAAMAQAPVSYTVPRTGLYYAVILVVGAWGTTQMVIAKGVSGAAGNGIGTLSLGTGVTTGQTALPANASTIAGGLTVTSGINYWVGAH